MLQAPLYSSKERREQLATADTNQRYKQQHKQQQPQHQQGQQLERMKSDSRPKTSFDELLSSLHARYAAQLEDKAMGIKTRAFPRKDGNPNYTFPCFEPEEHWEMFDTVQRQPAHEGFFYVKTHKTASTTVMGITIRIAKKAAERHNLIQGTNYTPCRVRFEHWPAHMLDYGNRKKDKSFLFAILREPTQRAISMYVVTACKMFY
jgi:hypothetical protein